jgi:hypothetical protein
LAPHDITVGLPSLRRRSPQYEKLAHDERRAPLDEEAAKPAESNGDGHAPTATTLPVSSAELGSPGGRAAAAAVVPENLLTFGSVARSGAVRCLQLDQEALISCREGLKSWCGCAALLPTPIQSQHAVDD